jgi:ABC-type cobalamin/Fe3+-siderophores transport system ATPase subunit
MFSIANAEKFETTYGKCSLVRTILGFLQWQYHQVIIDDDDLQNCTGASEVLTGG